MTTMVREPQQGFRPELAAMVAVISISSWHVGHYMSSVDGWVMASIMGAVLGYCNFLMAHNIFKPNSTSRRPAFVGLLFFALTSTWMQYTYFNNSLHITVTLVLGINIDALFLGLWAPAAEVLLGWLHAANSNVSSLITPLQESVAPVTSNRQASHSITTASSQHELETQEPVTNFSTEHEQGTEHNTVVTTVPNPSEQTSEQRTQQASGMKNGKSNIEPAKWVKEARLLWLNEQLQTIQADDPIPAQEWAEELHVSRQTIYRDVEEIKKQQNGVTAMNGVG